MADDRADKFDRTDFAARPDKRAATPPIANEKALPIKPAPVEKPAPLAPPTPPAPPMQSTNAAPKWQRSELRPDDQIVNIVETGPPATALLTDDARTGFVLRDGDSNRVILVDTGPAPAPRVAQGTAVPLVQGAPVALAQGVAVPMTAGQAVPLAQGTAVPADRETSPMSFIKQVLSNPALRTAAANALSSERSGDVAQQEQGESNFLGSLGSLLGNISSS